MGVYYISDAAGSDTTGAGTLGNPWKTFGKAFTVAGDGDYIYVRGGTYDQDNHSGVAVYPGYSGITIENYNGETVNVIAPTYGFYFPAGIDRIVMRGIDFDQGSTAASTVLQLGRIFSAGNTVEDCVLKYTDEAASGLRGIQLDGQFNKILNCEIGKIGVLGDAGWGEGIWITANGTYNLIQGCRIYDCSHNCIDIEGGRNNVVRECDFSNAYWRCCGPNGITTGDKTNIFEDNVFHDNHGDTDWGSKVSGLQNASQHTIIRRNRFYDLVGVAWTVSGGSLATCGENNYSYHNSSYNIYTENTSLSSALECNSPDPDNILFNGQL